MGEEEGKQGGDKEVRGDKRRGEGETDKVSLGEMVLLQDYGLLGQFWKSSFMEPIASKLIIAIFQDSCKILSQLGCPYLVLLG